MTYAVAMPPAEHIPGHRKCPACNALSRVGQRSLLPGMTFKEAFAVWLKIETAIAAASSGRVQQLKPRSVETYSQYAAAFAKRFGDLPLEEIHDGHLRQHAIARSADCGQNLIRKETDMVVRVMRSAGLWTKELKEAHRPLPMIKTDDQRALTHKEVERLMEALQEKPKREWVLYDSIVALHTCSSTFERRMSRRRRVDLEQRTFGVGPEQAKNKYRNRTIPLENDEVCFAFEWLLDRADQLGATEPDHFLYPLRIKRGVYDPTRPMTRFALIQQFKEIGEEIGIPDLHPYDLRHTAMSILAMAGTPISTIMAFGGQVSPEMHRHYTTVSLLAMREAHPIAWGNLQLLPHKQPPMRIVPERVASLAS